MSLYQFLRAFNSYKLANYSLQSVPFLFKYKKEIVKIIVKIQQTIIAGWQQTTIRAKEINIIHTYAIITPNINKKYINEQIQFIHQQEQFSVFVIFVPSESVYVVYSCEHKFLHPQYANKRIKKVGKTAKTAKGQYIRSSNDQALKHSNKTIKQIKLINEKTTPVIYIANDPNVQIPYLKFAHSSYTIAVRGDIEITKMKSQNKLIQSMQEISNL
ncbi:hypothetical protein TTHERM_000800229 (macronuclear) [Tetrahymena thermophila SB210]|uniref:Uncharacterized protein n=1 Tax=Tetrahymena thermophila (strain SB210) TaxID=312017 RepID=W7XJA4_TETTS|nr:hypothetical protein TTHERM_000800229 [Tetrahymena thermophila SB210]EWS75346.1 hypothetical protein TTHERM_000800229 [Tetrahymena thermophila SB210]|eukprot:XP_012652106.1 hypothetical protein TTHERM_000800229 [Tetrahymena thermophila SB210]